jgi:hypothetical protein
LKDKKIIPIILVNLIFVFLIIFWFKLFSPNYFPKTNSKLDNSIGKAIEYIAGIQNSDGSWNYFRSIDQDFKRKAPENNIFSTMMILFNLNMTKPDKFLNEGNMRQKAKEFLSTEMEEGQFWPFDGKNRHNKGKFGGIFNKNFKLVPDVDTTSVGNLVLNPSRDEYTNINFQFELYKSPHGLFQTYLANFYGKEGYFPEPKNYISLGVNLNILSFFSAMGVDTTSFVKSILKTIEKSDFLKNEIYYPSLHILSFFASNAVELGNSKAIKIMDSLMKDWENKYNLKKVNSYKNLNNMDLATYIKVQVHFCQLKNKKCNFLQNPIEELLRRQKPDGSWEVSPLHLFRITVKDQRDYYRKFGSGNPNLNRSNKTYNVVPQDIIYFYGSDSVTTSFCLRALNEYKKLFPQI